MSKITAALALGFALAAAGCAGKAAKPAATAPAERHCFNQAQVSGFRAVDRETVNLRVGASDIYQIKLLGVCPDIKWTEGVALETQGSSQICTGLDLTIHVPGPTGPQECAAESLRKLGPDEVAAMPAGTKP
ncbi:MAG: hypothetical protein IT548_18805 [Alphaproteobacteria bacterium]|nr:hypothetical protein [Alphaproteobacteria bacterium]